MSEYIECDWDINNYKWALEVAGATVLAFSDFGSYQGDWLAKVEWDGKTGWIKDYYGSCSGCDAFQAELNRDWEKGYKKQEVIDFGRRYFHEIKTYEEVLEDVSRNIEWDMGADDMVKFMEAYK